MFRRYPVAGSNLHGWNGGDPEAYFEREVREWRKLLDEIRALPQVNQEGSHP